MKTLDIQQNLFKKTCKWLDADCNCHITKCIKNWALREVFLDRIKELGVNYPEVYVDAFSEDCIDYKDNWKKCFDDRDKPKFKYEKMMNVDDDYLSTLEKEALEQAKELLRDDFEVMALYKEAKKKCIQRLRSQVEKEQKRIDEMESSSL